MHFAREQEEIMRNKSVGVYTRAWLIKKNMLHPCMKPGGRWWTINLLKFLLGFKSILYLLHSTYTSMCFHKNNCVKLVLFYLRLLEIDDQHREPSEKLGRS